MRLTGNNLGVSGSEGVANRARKSSHCCYGAQGEDGDEQTIFDQVLPFLFLPQTRQHVFQFHCLYPYVISTHRHFQWVHPLSKQSEGHATRRERQKLFLFSIRDLTGENQPGTS